MTTDPHTSSELEHDARAAAATRTRWAWLFATFFGVGYLPLGPGTWASVITVLLWYALASALPPSAQLPVASALAAALVLIGIPAGSKVCVECGVVDPSHIVMDEVAGQMIALLAVPHDWKYFVASLILFRLFDIMKPPPARQLERLHGGTGVMLDDVMAGIYALAGVHLLVYWRVF
jgi:phosphatidylglycerophosphatase A